MALQRLCAIASSLIVVGSGSVPISAAESPSRSIFNGRDLSGWVNVNGHPDTWRVEDAILVTTGEPTSFLRTDRMYENFILEFEWKHLPRSDDKEGNSGLFVWSDPLPAPTQGEFAHAVEVQILVNLEWRDKKSGAVTASSHGDVFAIWGMNCVPDRPHPRGWQRSLPHENRAKGFGAWNHYRVTARDGDVTLAVNGKEVTRLTDCSRRKGYLALEAEGNPVQFRDLRLQELPTSDPSSNQVAMQGAGWQRLYNGRDLGGWTLAATPPTAAENRWQANGWRLLHKGGREPKDDILWTVHQYGDFELIVDAKTAANADASILPVVLRAANLKLPRVMPTADEKPGEWARFHVTLKGDRLTVRRNETTVISNVAIAGMPPRGPLGLKPGNESMEFGNLYLRELP